MRSVIISDNLPELYVNVHVLVFILSVTIELYRNIPHKNLLSCTLFITIKTHQMYITVFSLSCPELEFPSLKIN